jgi:tRNA guanosine-2'-O-methyltransferase
MIVSKARGDIRGHLGFFLTGFLPWATMGELFTSTLVSTRDHTYASHGTVLVDVVARCVSDISDTPPPPIAASGTSDSTLLTPGPVSVLNGVLDFILEAQGKIFQFAILYLLEGLIKGLRAITNSVSLQGTLTPLEIDKIVRVSRLPGLPEITSDLCSEYCCQLCDLADPAEPDVDMIGYEQMRHQASVLRGSHQRINKCNIATPTVGDPPPLRTLRNQLEETNHRSIQGDYYPAVCEYVVDILDKTDHTVIDQADLYTILDALWEEADRRQFVRPVALHTPTVIFHPSCIRTCMLQQSNPVNEVTENNLLTLLAGAMDRLQGLAEGRSYILSTLGTTIRKAVFSCPEILSVLPFEDYFIRFFNSAPTIKPEFLFEVAAAQELQKHQPHRTYYAYYGQREWHAYAATIDLLRRFPQEQVSVAKHVLDRLLQPWRTQRAGIPIISKWKNVLQLQAMLLLVDFCVAEADADDYLAGFRQALILEPWPRYRFLLEWIIARIYYRFPGRSSSILNDLANVEKTSSTHIASLMKLAVLMAPHEMEEFSTTFMTHLVPFSASPKVQIRHESNYAIPIIFDLALARGWVSITENPTLTSLNKFIRNLDKFQTAPWTIRTLKLDAVQDYTIVNIFQGQYLTIESPERERVAYQDFLALQEADKATDLRVLPERISLGRPAHSDSIVELLSPDKANPGATGSKEQEMPAFFQTKAGFSIDSLHPPSGSPSTQSQRPASIVLVASLIDNPTNLGGLSRISESFGLEALYIDDLKKMAHKDFKATSVTSEKHLPIYELKVPKLPTFLLDMKRSGYQVVGIEQTDQSGVLGAEVGEATETRNLGTLPKRCVLVLGSEKGGITAEVLAVVDRCVEIRTVGVTRSLSKCDIK